MNELEKLLIEIGKQYAGNIIADSQHLYMANLKNLRIEFGSQTILPDDEEIVFIPMKKGYSDVINMPNSISEMVQLESGIIVFKSLVEDMSINYKTYKPKGQKIYILD